ncbi:MAG: DNA-formamidopyrimidine glycosylase [Candidatus Woesearchaeota archaeon]
MPELPEVETIVQQLKKKVLGKKITSVEILDRNKIDLKIKDVIPAKIVLVYRRAKAIVIELDRGNYLLVHLRMTGHFHYFKKGEEDKLKPFQKYVLVKFRLADGSLLTHNSIRKFGGIRLLNKKQLQTELDKLGPEPLEIELNQFKGLLQKRPKANIKTTLIDQKFISGVGNIYAQEALYHAGIDPKRKISTLSGQEIKKLHSGLKSLLKKAIKHHGTTVENYVHIEGSGGFQNHLAVYGQESCPKKHKLKKINLGGRGTYYCEKCQK